MQRATFRAPVAQTAAPLGVATAAVQHDAGGQLHGAAVIETSAGPVTVGLYGRDCPRAAANFLQLCELGFYNGCFVRRVLRDNYCEIHEHACLAGAPGVPALTAAALVAVDGLRRGAVDAKALPPPAVAALGRLGLETGNQLRGPLRPAPAGAANAPAGAANATAAAAAVPIASRRLTLDRPGLLLLFADNDDGDRRPTELTASCRFGFTLGRRSLAGLAGRVTVLGEVLAGMDVLTKLNAAALSPPGGRTAAAARGALVDDGAPVRLVRVKHTPVLHTPWPVATALPPPLRAAAASFSMAAAIRRLAPPAFTAGAAEAGAAAAAAAAADDPSAPRPSRSRLWPVDVPDIAGDDDDGNAAASPLLQSPRYNPACAPDDDALSSGDDEAALGTAVAAANTAAFAAAQRAADEQRVQRTHTLMLQLMRDLPDGDDIAPPENVLFVCKLNPLTASEDLAMVFGQFDDVKECEVIKDRRTGRSLQYAFIEFATVAGCRRAYSKMDNVLVDDSRIHVDFSQSVAKVWAAQRRQRAEATRAGAKRPRPPGADPPPAS